MNDDNRKFISELKRDIEPVNQNITIRQVIEKVLFFENESREKSNKECETNYKIIQPYSFLYNPTMCRLLETLLLRYYNNHCRYSDERIIEELNKDNLDTIAYRLYHEQYKRYYGNLGLGFRDKLIYSGNTIYPPLTTGVAVSYNFKTFEKNKNIDIVEITIGNFSGHWTKSQLFIDRSGLQIKERFLKGYQHNCFRKIILKRDKNNIYKVKMTKYEYPYRSNSSRPDIDKFEIDIRDLRNNTQDSDDYFEIILGSTAKDLLMIPSIQLTHDLEEITKRQGELVIDSNEVERRIKEDCQKSVSFKDTIREMGLLHEGR